MTKSWVFIVPMVILGILVFTFIGGQIVLQLWNWLLPPLFGFREITFWQALGILVLSRILFGGFGMGGSSRSRDRGRIADRVVDRVAERVGERWDAMTPEERERFRHRVQQRCGFDPSAGESTGASR